MKQISFLPFHQLCRKALSAAVLFYSAIILQAQSPVIYSSSGMFSVPACVTSFTVQCWGAGGGGGGASEATGGAAGAGGGGGGFATAVITNASGTYTVVVGTGGTGGVGTSNSGPNGTPGGSSFVTNGTDSVVAVGGGGGGGQTSAGVSTAVGAGGGARFTGVTGSSYIGGNGAQGNNQDDNTGGAGGGGAGNAHDGYTPNNTQEDANATGGQGGAGNPNTAQYAGGAGGGVSAAYYENGDNGSTIGGGGGGGGGETSGGIFGHGTSPGTGGNGGNGQVIITYTTSPATITNVTGSGCVGSTVTINGTLLSGATSVSIGSTAVTNLSITSTVITGTIAAGTITGTVTVVTPCGTATSPGSFTVYPNTGPIDLGTFSLCSGSYSFGGQTITTAGTYYDTTNNVHGCDSITKVTLVGGSIIHQAISQNLCGGGSYSFGGHTLTASGTYMDTATSTVTGCDSITTLTLTITPVLFHADTEAICPGGSYTFNGHSYNATGVYADTLAGAGTNGCDSISALILTVNAPATSVTNGAICNSASYTFNGVSYNTPGTYADTLSGAAANGCDSIAMLVLTLKSGSSDSVHAQATPPIFCSGDSTQICATPGFAAYNWGGGINTACFYTTNAGAYSVTVTDTSGCTANSNVVNVSNYQTTSVTISVSGDTLSSQGATAYQWFYDQQPIPGDTTSTIVATQSGNYEVEITDVHGCQYFSASTMVTTAISNIPADGNISVYPNPSNGSWQLAVSNDLIGSQYSIFDAEGRVVLTEQITSVHTSITPDFAKGVYMLQLRSGEVNYTVKLIKL